MKVGDVIASFRKEKKVDQAEFAHAIGVTITYVSLIENNKKKPSPTLMKKIARYFKVPVGALIIKALIESKEGKKYPDVVKAAEPLFDQLVDFFSSETDAKKKTAPLSKKRAAKKRNG